MIIFSDGALTDLDRIFEFNAERDPAVALQHIAAIQSAVLTLNDHPRIGRRVASGSALRELVIAQGAMGYVAIYEYFPLDSNIVIHAVRHQREASGPID